MQSINPISKEVYTIPSLNEENGQIDTFLKSNQGKKVVVVQGLGFVGAVMSIVCANALTEEYAVIGVDLPREDSYWKIPSLNSGHFPITAEDPKIDEFYKNALSKGNFLATSSPYAFAHADVIIVDINLDVQKTSSDSNDLEGYDVSMVGFTKAIQSIGENCKEDVLILVETTVPPGTSQKIALPTILENLKKRGLGTDKVRVGHSYERVMPGPNYIDSIQNFYRVYAGVDQLSAEATESFLRTIISTKKYPLTRLKNTNSTEMAKVLENSFRAMNIAFISEWARFAEEAEVDLFEVVKAIRMRPTHKNLMLPGLGVGGYCLTKDPLLASWSRQNLFDSDRALSVSESAVRINDQMPLSALEWLEQNYPEELDDKRVLMLGVSYRSDVGDTRYTPVELFYKRLIQKNTKITLHDPYINYWEEQNLEVDQNLGEVLSADYDLVIITTGHSIYKDQLFLDKLISKRPIFVFDTIGIWSTNQNIEVAEKHQLLILGNGHYKM